MLHSDDVVDITMCDRRKYHNMIIGAIEEDGVKGYFRPNIPHFSELYKWDEINKIEILTRRSGHVKYFSNQPIEDDGLKAGVCNETTIN